MSPRTRTLKSAKYYLNQKWSIFPVFADARPDVAKQPAVRWQIYQQRPPDAQEVSDWFAQGQFSGIAIVTGHISRLIVLDFDTPDLYATFCATFPHLAQTRTITTRRGKHLYYTLLPSLQSPRTLHGAGVDLQSDGAYVVAPPTTINGFTYSADNDLSPHTLIPADLALIQTFVRQTNEHKNRQLPSATTRVTQHPTITADTLQRMYLDNLHKGRNNALFTIACLARDYGLPQATTIGILGNLHASRPPTHHHHKESHSQRLREADRTIASVYSHPPRPVKSPLATPQLPNRLREHLLAMKLMGVIRTIEGLRLNGILPGMTFTAGDAVALLSGIVGRDTIRTALATTSPTEEAVFATPTTPPSPRAPLIPHGIADSIRPQATNSCELVTVTKAGKNAKGRPSIRYTMPSNDQLLALFALPSAKRSDAISLDDLKSVATTRQKMHQTFLTRLPGRWAISTFAQRLNITTRTIRRYHAHDENFRHIPLHHTTTVRWDSLKYHFATPFPHKGFFLTDSKDKKYPAMQGIAERLLAKRQRVHLHQRLTNFWWYSTSDTPPITTKHTIDIRIVIENTRAERRIAPPTGESQIVATTTPHHIASSDANTSSITTPPNPSLTARHVAKHQLPLLTGMPVKSSVIADEKPKRRNTLSSDHTLLRDPLPNDDQEHRAMRLYTAINAKATDDSGRITKIAARRLICRYSASAIEEALHLLHTRQNITKPVGFISTVLRSSCKAHAS